MSIRQKLQPVDYAVMFGGPIAFFLIFWIGVRLIVGPVPEANPIKKLREGEVQIGARMSEVNDKLGRPNEAIELPDGGFKYVYTRTVYEEETKSDSLDEATILFTPDGLVRKIDIERTTPPRSPE